MTTTSRAIDPWDRAMNPFSAETSEISGRCTIKVWTCGLIKGQGKVPYTPGMTDPKTGKELRPFTAIEVTITRLSAGSEELAMTRQFIAEFGEWPGLVLPSLRKLGITDLKSLDNRWVQAELVTTGGTYTNRNGETRDATTFKFMKVFANEAECRAAADLPSKVKEQAQEPLEQAIDDNKERETAYRFLQPYVRNAVRSSQGDLMKINAQLAAIIAGQPLLMKYFSVDSEVVIDLITKEMSS